MAARERRAAVGCSVSGRRTFLAGAGAIAASAVLPGIAKAEPDWRTRDELQLKFLLMLRQLGEAERLALLNGMLREQAGMPIEDAIRGVYLELGRAPPIPTRLS